MKTVFITGCNSGIGQATAHLLDQKGWQVFAGVYPEADTGALEQNTSSSMMLIPIDVTKNNMIRDAIATIQRQTDNGGLDALVNNAGMAVSGPLEALPVAAIRKQLDVNFFGHAEVTQAALPLIRQRTGRIINVTSILSKIVTPFGAPYSASKFALRAYTDALRMELKPWGIHVSAIEPTAIKTGIWKQNHDFQEEVLAEMNSDAREKYGDAFLASIKSSRELGESGVEPVEVAQVIYQALTAKTPKARYGVGKSYWLYSLISHMPDSIREYFLLRN